MPTIESGRRGVFSALLFATMGVGTFAALSLGIIAVVFIEDIEL
jgi:hypothetical protein